VLPLQVCSDFGELGEGGLEVFDDFDGDLLPFCSDLLEVIAVEFLDSVGVFFGDTDFVLDHQLGQTIKPALVRKLIAQPARSPITSLPLGRRCSASSGVSLNC